MRGGITGEIVQLIHDSALQSALMRDPGRDSNWGQKFQKGSLKLFYQCARAAAAERHFACKSLPFHTFKHYVRGRGQ